MAGYIGESGLLSTLPNISRIMAIGCFGILVSRFPLTYCDELIGEVSVWGGIERGEEIHSLLGHNRWIILYTAFRMHNQKVETLTLHTYRNLVMPVAHRFPSSFKALVLQNQREQHNKSLYNDVRIVERPIPALKPGEILVKINAAGFNHREVRSAFAQKMGGRCSDLSLNH